MYHMRRLEWKIVWVDACVINKEGFFRGRVVLFRDILAASAPSTVRESLVRPTQEVNAWDYVRPIRECGTLM